jgi:hypothetical protein
VTTEAWTVLTLLHVTLRMPLFCAVVAVVGMPARLAETVEIICWFAATAPPVHVCFWYLVALAPPDSSIWQLDICWACILMYGLLQPESRYVPCKMCVVLQAAHEEYAPA